MILISFFHITNTERNITQNVLENCYKKNRFHHAVVTLELRSAQENSDKTLHDFSQDFYEVNLNWNTTCFKEIDLI